MTSSEWNVHVLELINDYSSNAKFFLGKEQEWQLVDELPKYKFLGR